MKDKSQFLPWLKFLLGWPLSLISIGFILKLIIDKSSQIQINLNGINYASLLAAIVLFYTYYLLRSYLWRTLLSEKGYKKIGFIDNTYRFAFSELKRYTPGNVWSILSRASQFKEIGVDNKSVGESIIADSQLVIIGCAVVSLGAIPILLGSSSELRTRLLDSSPIIIVVLLAWFLGTALIYKKRYAKDEKLISNLVLPSFSLQSKVKVSIISIITYAFFGFGSYFAYISLFSSSQNPLVLGSFFVFALLVGFLSFITPMGLGVREAVVVIGLSSLIGVTNAGVASIFTRIVLVASELSFLTLIFLWEKLSKK